MCSKLELGIVVKPSLKPFGVFFLFGFGFGLFTTQAVLGAYPPPHPTPTHTGLRDLLRVAGDPTGVRYSWQMPHSEYCPWGPSTLPLALLTLS